MHRYLNYVTVGYFLLSVYLLQEFADIRWEYLDQLQKDEMYKRWSGLVLAIFMLFQWSLTLVKTIPAWTDHIERFTSIHKWMGALSPIIFYVHAMRFGYAYLLFFSFCFFANLVLGLLNIEQLKTKANWYYQGWMIAHVALSLLITLFMFYHSFIAFYYK